MQSSTPFPWLRETSQGIVAHFPLQFSKILPALLILHFALKTFGKARKRSADGERGLRQSIPVCFTASHSPPKKANAYSLDLPNSAHGWRYGSRSSLAAVIDPIKHPPQHSR